MITLDTKCSAQEDISKRSAAALRYLPRRSDIYRVVGLSVLRAVELNVFRVAGLLVFIPRSSLIFCSVQQLSVPCSSFLCRAGGVCNMCRAGGVCNMCLAGGVCNMCRTGGVLWCVCVTQEVICAVQEVIMFRV